MDSDGTHRAASLAPRGFLFPTLYLDLARGALPDIRPWGWLSASDGSWSRWSQQLEARYPERSLVPFALCVETRLVYCFEGTDLSGNPPVHVIQADAPSGSEYRGKWSDFEAWLFEADNVHGEWLLRIDLG